MTSPDQPHGIGPELRTVRTDRLVRRVFLFCVLAEISLVIFDYLFNLRDLADARQIRRIWNIAREESVPTWFSSTQAVCVGVAAILVCLAKRAQGGRGFRVSGWFLVGCWFVFLGIDDASEIHERLGGFLGGLAEEDPDSKPALVRFLMSFPTYNWQRFIAPVYGVLLISSIAFAWRDFWPGGPWKFLIAGFVLYVTSQGLDYLEGHDGADLFYQDQAESFGLELYTVTHTFKVVEECLEMLGTTMFLVAFLHYLSSITDGLTLRFSREQD